MDISKCGMAGRAVVLATVLWAGPVGLFRAPGALAGQAAHGAMEPATLSSRMQVIHEAQHRELVVLMGPFSLPGSGNTMRVTPAEAVTVPVNGRLTQFRTRVLDPQGNELPEEILHHINIVNPGRRELFMPVMQRIAAAGQETGRIDVPFPFGVPVSRGDTLLYFAMLYNPTGRDLEVTIEARLRYEISGGLDRFDVQPFYLDIQQPPASASFDLPPGPSAFTWEGSPAVNAELLGIGGHLHEYATELRLEELRPGKDPAVLWRTRPVAAADGAITRIPRETFLLRFGLGLRADRTYRIVALYENPTGQAIPDGGMAEIAGVVWPRASWPAPDPADPRFREDCRHFLRGNPPLRDSLCGGTSAAR